MNYPDYHTHNHLCKHASGKPEDYIKKAIEKGISEIGFSDHAPIPEKWGDDISMSPEQTEEYIQDLLILKETYKDKIAVRIGFEVEHPFLDTFDRGYLTDKRIDYLIGSSHLIGDWMFDHDLYVDEYKKRNIDDIYSRHYSNIKNIILSGHFNIVGHLDLVKKFGHRPSGDFNKIINSLADLISDMGTAVEINTSGLRKPVKEIYPSTEIIKTLFEKNVPVTLGSDAHCPEEVGYEFPFAVEVLKKAGYRKISGFSKRKRYDIDII